MAVAAHRAHFPSLAASGGTGGSGVDYSAPHLNYPHPHHHAHATGIPIRMDCRMDDYSKLFYAKRKSTLRSEKCELSYGYW